MDWYYALNNQQQGPVSEDEIRRLAQQGIIKPETLIWRQGMADWQPYYLALPANPNPIAGFGGPAQRPIGQTPSRMEQYAPRPAGTGGITPNSELRAAARDALSGKWMPSFGFVLVIWLANMVAGMIPVVGTIAPLLVSGPFTLSMKSNFLNVSRGEESDFGMIFSGFHDFGRALGVYFVMSLIALGLMFLFALLGAGIIGAAGGFNEQAWDQPSVGLIMAIAAATFLLVLPAFYVQLKFAFMYFVLADEPQMSFGDVLSTGFAMTKGHMGKLAMMYLSFVGWGLLAMMTLGIGFFLLAPYIMVSTAKFYDDVRV